ncbi:XRE family transcriptional regulator [Actinocorallia sp. A-T 12471]|uniref:helix-turn-helix domain-containing protein n=1 Tax=Actinocorallia sp. A-T 12471 TaxID=3089813 RepID=UPI0029CD0A01|nr:XRE family transcriptional regulator [Actinocorallia sp. A-T 12471]MDX6744517.1 XRE family transcriptional regulator [Actinocorallia sp. A-T 12471]
MSIDQVPERVRRVIMESGLSQTEFAVKAGLDGPKMSKSLAGVRRFTSLDLARIAEVAGVTVDFLLGNRTAPVASAARVTNASSANAALEQAQHFARLREDLTFLGYSQKPLALRDPAVGGTWIEQGARLAAVAVRAVRECGTEPVHTRDLAGLVETVFGVDVASADLHDGVEGLAWADDAVRLIVVATSQVPARQRFTIAHELGHLLAADDQRIHVDSDIDSAEHRRSPSEIRANAFAASFLLPEDYLRRHAPASGDWDQDTFAELACRLWVSPSTLAWRLFNLDLITRAQRETFRRMGAADAAARAGQVGALAEWIGAASRPAAPQALVRDTYRAYTDGKSTLRPFADLLGVDTATLRESLDQVWEETPLTP